MTLESQYVDRMIEACAEHAYEQARKMNPGLPMMPWASLNPLQKHGALEAITEWLAPAFPVVEEMLKVEVGLHAGVLRGRVEMFIDELRGRGETNIAAELETIINAPMED